VVVELKYQLYYLSTTLMLHQKIKIVNRRRISQSEIRNSAAAESEGGQKFLPPNPLPFCPPERSVSVLPREARQSISFVQNRFGFGQINAPVSNFQIFSRPIRRRNAPPHTAKWGFRALRARPSGGSKSLAILSICFAQLKTNNINL